MHKDKVCAICSTLLFTYDLENVCTKLKVLHQRKSNFEVKSFIASNMTYNASTMY